MINRVKIDGYKSFRDFELEMKPLMVVFGPNASGKSNFLDALQLISLIATEKDIKTAFSKHRGTPWESIFGGITRVKKARKKLHSMHFEVDIELGDLVCEKTNINMAEHRRQVKKRPVAEREEVDERNWRSFTELQVLYPSMET